MYQIDIANTQDCLELDENFLAEVAERVLAEEQVAGAEISVALVDNATIHELNRQYLGHNYATDVLSFLLDSRPSHGENPEAEPPATLRGRGLRLDGEVIISTEMALEDAKNFGWSPREEVVLYLIHGLLHLVGYDDLSSTERDVMRARERAMLALFQMTLPSPSVEGPSTRSSATEADDGSDEDPERSGSASLPPTRRTES